LVLEVTSNVSALFAAAARFTALGATESVAPVEEHRLLAVEPAPVGAVVEVVMLILSSCAPSSRYANVNVWLPAFRLNVFGNCAHVHEAAVILFQLTQEPPSILTHQESSFPPGGHETRANTL
jgi:hypothetical protein